MNVRHVEVCKSTGLGTDYIGKSFFPFGCYFRNSIDVRPRLTARNLVVQINRECVASFHSYRINTTAHLCASLKSRPFDVDDAVQGSVGVVWSPGSQAAPQTPTDSFPHA